MPKGSEEFTRIIKSRMAYMDLDGIRLAKKMNVCEKTMGKYIRNPLSMDVCDLKKLIIILQISDEDLLAFMR